jgi:hypothetical protein
VKKAPRDRGMRRHFERLDSNALATGERMAAANSV